MAESASLIERESASSSPGTDLGVLSDIDTEPMGKQPRTRRQATRDRKKETRTRGATTGEFRTLATGAQTVAFLTDPDSPFPDKYSIEQEGQFLRPLLQGDADPNHPLYPRLEEYQDRLRQQASLAQTYEARHQTPADVTLTEARTVEGMRGLESDDSDVMVLHTKQAWRLFAGRGPGPDPKAPNRRLPPIPGAKLQASLLRSLHILSANDNPYVDWALISEQGVNALNSDYADFERFYEQATSRSAAIGIEFHLLANPAPGRIPIVFRSPYGYSIAKLVVAFDHHMRRILTLNRKGFLSDEQTYAHFRNTSRGVRSLFHQTEQLVRSVIAPDVVAHSRRDFMVAKSNPESPEATRVATLHERLGPVPRSILTGELQPQYSRRNPFATQIKVTVQEITRLLTEDPEIFDMTQAPAETRALGMDEPVSDD